MIFSYNHLINYNNYANQAASEALLSPLRFAACPTREHAGCAALSHPVLQPLLRKGKALPAAPAIALICSGGTQYLALHPFR